MMFFILLLTVRRKCNLRICRYCGFTSNECDVSYCPHDGNMLMSLANVEGQLENHDKRLQALEKELFDK